MDTVASDEVLQSVIAENVGPLTEEFCTDDATLIHPNIITLHADVGSRQVSLSTPPWDRTSHP